MPKPIYRDELRDSDIARFWGYTGQAGGEECWDWFGAFGTHGYGVLNIRGKVVTTHRLSWALAHGFVPGDRQVLHRCDRRCCVNPAHLFLGVDADNVRDKVEKGRHPRGEDASQAKLTNEDVIQILDLLEQGISPKEISSRYGISRTTVSNIRTGDQWSHLTGRTWAQHKRVGEECSFSKLRSQDVEAIIRASSDGDTHELIAKQFGVSRSTIGDILNGRSWGHITGLARR